MITTWIRVEDQFAQFDHPKDKKLPKGVTKVKDHPEHTGAWARDPKRKTSKSGGRPAGQVSAIPEGEPSEDWTVKQLDAYADAHGIDLAGASTKAEKLAGIENGAELTGPTPPLS